MICQSEPTRERVKVSHVVVECRVINHHPAFRDSNFSLRIPKVRLDLSKNNFVFNACMLWNNFENIVFSRIIPDANGIMVPGSSKNSNFAIIDIRCIVVYNVYQCDPLICC